MIESIDHNPDCAVLKFSGKVTSQEISDARKVVIDHPDFKRRKYHIWIFESVDDIVLDSDQMRRISREDVLNAEDNPDLKVALVCDTEVAFGVCRMYEGYASDLWRVGVFRSVPEARDWIDSLPDRRSDKKS